MLERKGISWLWLVVLMLVSAIIGGVLAYMFTISYYVSMEYRIPRKEPTLVITDVIFDVYNPDSFMVCVLNPSYSPSNATITGIALNVKGESELYDVETTLSLENGTVVGKGEFLNITCSRIKMEEPVQWNVFAGKTVIVHVFALNASAANKEVVVPFVTLNVKEAKFDPKIGFQNFSITVENPSSMDLTIEKVFVSEVGEFIVGDERIYPRLPYTLSSGETVTFNCFADWHGVKHATIEIYTEEGYIIRHRVEEIPTISAYIKNVTFNINMTDRCQVTIENPPESVGYANVTKIVFRFENESKRTFSFDPYESGIEPNSSRTFVCEPFIWKDYRDKNVTVIACMHQGFNTTSYVARTPQPVILKILEKEKAFDLERGSIVKLNILNHNSSIYAVNITEISLPGLLEKPITETYGPIQPGENKTLQISVDWVDQAGNNVTVKLKVVLLNETVKTMEFEFHFLLPVAKLKVEVSPITKGEIMHLNVTIINSPNSTQPITISRVVVSNGTSEITTSSFIQEISEGKSIWVLLTYGEPPTEETDITITVYTVEGFTFHWKETIVP